MRSKEKVPLKISVMPSTSTRQFEIRSNFHDTAGEWEDIYVDFSGFFGRFSPHVFASAPELYAVVEAMDNDDVSDDEFNRMRKAALAKARGAS